MTGRRRGRIYRSYRIEASGIEATVEEKPVRNINLRVLPPDGQVFLSCPPGCPHTRLTQMLSRHLKMIEKAQARYRATANRGFIALSEARPLLEAIVTQAEPHLLERCRQAFPGVQGYRQAPGLRIKQMRSLWGSYSRRTHRISLNSELAGLAPRFGVYVFGHELAHVVVAGHGSQFKAALDQILPNWRQTDHDLKKKSLPR